MRALCMEGRSMYGRNRRCGDPLVVGPPRMGVSDTLHEVSDLAESRLARNY